MAVGREVNIGGEVAGDRMEVVLGRVHVVAEGLLLGAEMNKVGTRCGCGFPARTSPSGRRSGSWGGRSCVG